MSVTYNGTLVRNFIYNDTTVGSSTTLYTQSELDSIATAVSSKGQTPASNTPSDIVSAIGNITPGIGFGGQATLEIRCTFTYTSASSTLTPFRGHIVEKTHPLIQICIVYLCLMEIDLTIFQLLQII